jgi:uncharacterized protein
MQAVDHKFDMKRLVLLLVVAILPFALLGQTKPVKVVFDVTSADSLTHQAVLRHVTLMASAYPASEFEVVVYGGSLPMFVKDKSTVSKSIQQLVSNPKVSFRVCEQTMKKYNVDKSQLLPGVQTVPDGILEIVNKQTEGWAYIKESHH